MVPSSSVASMLSAIEMMLWFSIDSHDRQGYYQAGGRDWDLVRWSLWCEASGEMTKTCQYLAVWKKARTQHSGYSSPSSMWHWVGRDDEFYSLSSTRCGRLTDWLSSPWSPYNSSARTVLYEIILITTFNDDGVIAEALLSTSHSNHQCTSHLIIQPYSSKLVYNSIVQQRKVQMNLLAVWPSFIFMLCIHDSHCMCDRSLW